MLWESVHVRSMTSTMMSSSYSIRAWLLQLLRLSLMRGDECMILTSRSFTEQLKQSHQLEILAVDCAHFIRSNATWLTVSWRDFLHYLLDRDMCFTSLAETTMRPSLRQINQMLCCINQAKWWTKRETSFRRWTEFLRWSLSRKNLAKVWIELIASLGFLGEIVVTSLWLELGK